MEFQWKKQKKKFYKTGVYRAVYPLLYLRMRKDNLYTLMYKTAESYFDNTLKGYIDVKMFYVILLDHYTVWNAINPLSAWAFF